MDFSSALGDYFNSLEERNIENFKKMIKDDEKTTLIFPNGKIMTGYQAIIDFHSEWFKDMDWSMKYIVMEANELGNVGYGLVKVTYDDIGQNSAPYTINYYLSLLFEKLNGKWLLFHDQNTLITD